MATATILHDAYTEGWEGNIQPYALQPEPSVHGARRRRFVKEILVDAVSATDTVTVTGAIPAGAFNVIVVARVTTIIVMGGGGATWALGSGSDVDTYATGKAKTAGITVSPADYAADNAAQDIFQTATDIILTANAGTWTSGAVRLVIFYELATAPTG